MAKVSITVCDVDQTPGKPTKRYQIKTDGKVANVDLCAEHGAPIDKILGTSARSRRTVGARATTVEDIEKGKGVVA